VSVDDVDGHGWLQPVTAALLTIFLLSLIGVPTYRRLLRQVHIFKTALDANLVWLTILGC